MHLMQHTCMSYHSRKQTFIASHTEEHHQREVTPSYLESGISQLLFIGFVLFCQMKRMDTLLDFLDFPFTFQIQPTKRMVYCALRTKTTLKPQYLTLSTSHAVTMGDTSSTSITGHILRFPTATLHTPSMNSAKYRFTVYVDI